MINLIIKWLIMAIGVLAAAYLLPGVSVGGFGAALLVALALGIINVLIKPILIILTLPINILTLGLFTFVINALLILLAAAVVPGFQVNNFGWAILFGIILSLVVFVFKKILL